MTRRCNSRGFSLIELGIALGVLVTMMTVVLSVRGFLNAAKIGATVSMVDTLQKTSRAWAERNCHSACFINPGTGVPVSVAELQATQLLPAGAFTTPWDDPGVTVAPKPGDNTRIVISFPVPNLNTAADCASALNKMGIVTTVGPSVSIDSR